jgi:hypothetical protein
MPSGVNRIDSWGGSTIEYASEEPPASQRVIARAALDTVLINGDFLWREGFT